MSARELEFLKILADGEVHSGEVLARQTGVSRTAVWKQLNKLRGKNLEVITVKGQGYRLASPLELLDPDLISSSLAADTAGAIQSVECYFETISTNQLLLEHLQTASIHGRVVLSEFQSAGRGRGSNKWLGGLGAGLYISLGWHFDLAPPGMSALSLAAGVSVARVLNTLVEETVGLKWPNDLVCNGAKVAGILIESRGQHAGMVDVVIGVGINFDLPGGIVDQIEQKVTDLKTIAGSLPPRNRVAADIIDGVVDMLIHYPERGFEPWIDSWRSLDICRGRDAELHLGGRILRGEVIDIDEQGMLIMYVDNARQKYSSGELSLRLIN